MVYNVHMKQNPLTGTPNVDGRGKHMKHCISADKYMEVRNHIESFPTVNSHCCRAKTNKQYVDSHLNQLKMYDLYVENCRKENKDKFIVLSKCV